MKLLRWFTMGFSLPGLLAICQLVKRHILNEWSGNSPLNYIYWIPVFYLAYLCLSVLYLAISRRRVKNSKHIFFAGIVGGLSLVPVSIQLTSVWAGLEIPIILISAACMALLLRLGTIGVTEQSEADHVFPPANNQ